jgi:hypothetical protein
MFLSSLFFTKFAVWGDGNKFIIVIRDLLNLGMTKHN